MQMLGNLHVKDAVWPIYERLIKTIHKPNSFLNILVHYYCSLLLLLLLLLLQKFVMSK